MQYKLAMEIEHKTFVCGFPTITADLGRWIFWVEKVGCGVWVELGQTWYRSVI